MSIFTVGKISQLNPNTSEAEISFDGRVIGSFSAQGDMPGTLEIATHAKPEDLRNAGIMAVSDLKFPSLQACISELFRAELAKHSALRKMRSKLKKNTLFATPGQRVQSYAVPYCERIRARIKKDHPEAVILNTLSEEEAFKHFTLAR